MEACLEIRNLSKKYNSFFLEDINLILPKGSIMGLIGENGVGKTTTIKAILNLVNRDSGVIKIFGLDNIKYEKEIKEQIGVVLEEGYFHDNLMAKDILIFMKEIYKDFDVNLFDDYLKKFKIPKGKVVKELSKGMKMKLSIVTALSHRPKLLILDEPTSGLDPVSRSEILDVFYDFIQDEEHSILLSSHITSDLEKIADYITFVHDGKIMFSDETDKLLCNYAVIKCNENKFSKIDKIDVVAYRKNKFSYEVLVNDKKLAKNKYSDLVIDNTNLEEILVFLIRGQKL
jgi:ABC-2 type transport system ATP-binding protein